MKVGRERFAGARRSERGETTSVFDRGEREAM